SRAPSRRRKTRLCPRSRSLPTSSSRSIRKPCGCCAACSTQPRRRTHDEGALPWLGERALAPLRHQAREVLVREAVSVGEGGVAPDQLAAEIGACAPTGGIVVGDGSELAAARRQVFADDEAARLLPGGRALHARFAGSSGRGLSERFLLG